ncbi:MAG: DUF3472 domain-containing protein [Pirellulaceae bacterium]
MNCANNIIRTLLILVLSAATACGEEWIVPLAGNTFRVQADRNGESGGRTIGRDGTLRLSKPNEVYSVFFHVDRPGTMTLAIEGHSVTNERISVAAQVADQPLATELQGGAADIYSLGDVKTTKVGYLRVDLYCPQLERGAAVALSALQIKSDTEGLQVDFVRNNEGNMFYWGRRGPSVHLSYQLPVQTELVYAYSEIMVPAGEDPIGSYFMANGFGEGYFGFQVNSSSERRVLFSVWSPFRTDNPAEIPPEDRVATLSKGENVKAQDFGNEGSGGQSYLVYPWKADVTYRFLTEVKPDGHGNTEYTSWFGDKQANEWLLIASFRRPKTDKHLTGYHSFLESFSPDFGYLQRSAAYGNQWVQDVNSKWHEITRATFTGDNTARGRHRLDYAGGTRKRVFFLQNCGFFDERVELDQAFERQSTARQIPQIEFAKLPR